MFLMFSIYIQGFFWLVVDGWAQNQQLVASNVVNGSRIPAKITIFIGGINHSQVGGSWHCFTHS